MTGPRLTVAHGSPLRGERSTPPTDLEIAHFAEYCRHRDARTAARAMGIAESTLKNQVGMLYRKLGVKNARQAAFLLWGPGDKAA